MKRLGPDARSILHALLVAFLLASSATAREQVSFETQDPEPKQLIVVDGSAHAQFLFAS